MQVADNGSAAELDDGSVRAGDVCADQSHQMLACRVSIPILICVYNSLLDTNYTNCLKCSPSSAHVIATDRVCDVFDVHAATNPCSSNIVIDRYHLCSKFWFCNHSLVVVMFEYAFCSRKTLYPVDHIPNRLCVIA